jgi:hypothetical protein
LQGEQTEEKVTIGDSGSHGPGYRKVDVCAEGLRHA